MNAKPMLLVILMAVPAFGQSVYKCPGPNGTIYQGKPCTDGAGTLMIDGGTDSRSRAERNPASGPPDPAEIIGQAHGSFLSCFRAHLAICAPATPRVTLSEVLQWGQTILTSIGCRFLGKAKSPRHFGQTAPGSSHFTCLAIGGLRWQWLAGHLSDQGAEFRRRGNARSVLPPAPLPRGWGFRSGPPLALWERGWR